MYGEMSMKVIRATRLNIYYFYVIILRNPEID